MSLMSSVSFVPKAIARQAAFVGVGGLGFLVQLSALAALMSLAHWSWLPATLVSVELAVAHNFFWHDRWTWKDRRWPAVGATGRAPAERCKRCLRFHLANGVISIAGNIVLMAFGVAILGLPAIPANALAVAVISAANFVIADRWVFAVGRRSRACSGLGRDDASACEIPGYLLILRQALLGRHQGRHDERRVERLMTSPSTDRSRRRPTYALVVIALAIPIHASAAPTRETLSAWERYVAATETRLGRTWASTAVGERPSEAIAASGESIHVRSGTISDWRGSVFLPGVTLDRLLDRLQHPGTPPPQEDVVSSRVIARGPDSLSVAIRLVRRAIVTVKYDTEHEMRFRRVTPTVATARSVATRIEEVDGGDHGFLWRLHSYWRYEETDVGVQVELESLTLSRDVPSLVRPIAAPLVNRIARESMIRTLEALRQFMCGNAIALTRAGD